MVVEIISTICTHILSSHTLFTCTFCPPKSILLSNRCFNSLSCSEVFYYLLVFYVISVAAPFINKYDCEVLAFNKRLNKLFLAFIYMVL